MNAINNYKLVVNNFLKVKAFLQQEGFYVLAEFLILTYNPRFLTYSVPSVV